MDGAGAAVIGHPADPVLLARGAGTDGACVRYASGPAAAGAARAWAGDNGGCGRASGKVFNADFNARFGVAAGLFNAFE